MNPEFDVQSIAAGAAVTVLRVNGRLDAQAARTLAARCAEVRGAGRHLVLNLARVTFIASSGVGALLSLVEEFRGSRSRVRLAEVSPAVLSVIDLLNLRAFLSISPDEGDATRALEEAA